MTSVPNHATITHWSLLAMELEPDDGAQLLLNAAIADHRDAVAACLQELTAKLVADKFAIPIDRRNTCDAIKGIIVTDPTLITRDLIADLITIATGPNPSYIVFDLVSQITGNNIASLTDDQGRLLTASILAFVAADHGPGDRFLVLCSLAPLIQKQEWVDEPLLQDLARIHNTACYRRELWQEKERAAEEYMICRCARDLLEQAQTLYPNLSTYMKNVKLRPMNHLWRMETAAGSPAVN